MADSIRAHVRVTGMVQGVGFRWYTLRCARQCGVAGWVKNAPDGSVEIEVEGDPAAVQTFVEDVSEGPASSEVSDVSLQRIPVQGETTFEVKR